MDDFLINAQVEEWYQHTPLGTLHDDSITDAEHRHLELLGKDDLTEAEANELETLSDAFVMHLNQEVASIKF